MNYEKLYKYTYEPAHDDISCALNVNGGYTIFFILHHNCYL